MVSLSDPYRLQNALRENLYWFLHPQSSALDGSGEHHVAQVARMLAAGYTNLSFDERPVTVVAKRPPVLSETQYLASDADYRRPVVELARYARAALAPYLSGFYLHGSLASLDYARGWSDVDTLMVVARETATDSRRLIELRDRLRTAYDLLLAVDPLQHHGFIVATDIDLECFPTCYLPPVVLDHALSLLPAGADIAIRCRDATAEIRSAMRSRLALFRTAVEIGEFRHHARDGEHLVARWRNAHNAMYQLKYFLSLVMIQPAQYLEAVGRASYKRDSFELCRPLFQAQWDIVERASTVRRMWPNRESHPFCGNAVPEWVREVVGEDYFERGLALVTAISDRLDVFDAARR